MHKYRDDSYINTLVDDFKEKGSEELRLQLMDCFDPYFSKYCYMLCSKQVVDFTNNDTIKFLRLFMTPEEREPAESFLLAARRIIGYLRGIFKDYTSEDLYDEIVCMFLEQLSRYQPMITNHKLVKERISFSHFIQVNLRFKIRLLAVTRAKDALTCFHNVEYNDSIQGYKEPEVGINWNVLDLRWVQGITASDHFKELDELERYILYLRYEDEDKKPVSDRDIARMTGLDRMAIRRRLVKIRNKLKELI